MLKFMSCMFTAKEGGGREFGVAQLNAQNDVMGIIDFNGELVPAPIWNYHLMPDVQTAVFEPPKHVIKMVLFGHGTKRFEDWYDFADWAKQITDGGHAVQIYSWEYV